MDPRFCIRPAHPLEQLSLMYPTVGLLGCWRGMGLVMLEFRFLAVTSTQTGTHTRVDFIMEKFCQEQNSKITSPESTMQAQGTRVKHLLKTALLFHQTLLMGVAHDQFQLFSIGFNTVAPVIVTH